MARDYYDVLGVAVDATADEIKLAFRTLAREHHPDATGGDPDSEHLYKEISEAYAVLSDPQKRQQFDAARLGVGNWQSPWGSPFASTIDDIFETFFGGGGTQTRRRTRARQGESLEMEVVLSLEEVVFGGTRTLEFSRYEVCEDCAGNGAAPGSEPEHCSDCNATGQVQQTRRTILGNIVTAFPCRRCEGTGWVTRDPCRACKGSGRAAKDAAIPLEIPAGLDEGDRMRLDGEGEAGLTGGSRGDLYVRFRVAGDERFERLGDDLLAWVDVPMTVAALGGKIKVSTLDGEESIEVASGTQSTAAFRLRGLGVARRRGRGRGDLIVRANVVVPTKLSRKEKELLKELAQQRGDDPKDEDLKASRLRRILGDRDR